MTRAAWLPMVVCLALAGCGESAEEPDRPPAARLFDQAARRTLAEGGVEVERRVRANDGSVEIVSEGRTRLEFDKAHVVETYVRAPGIPQGARFEAVYDAWLYLRRPGTGRWQRTESGRFGVSDTLAFLQKAATDLRYSGDRTLRGVAATRIDGVFDLRRLIRGVPADERPLTRRALDTLEPVRMPLSVWIDGRRRIRQWRLRGDLDAMARGLGGTQGTEVTRFKAFDSRIEITAPPSHLVDAEPPSAGSPG